jgi:Predicted transcriptional regulators
METYGERIQAAIAAQVRAEIAALGWKQADLANKAGVPTSTLGRYLKGERDIPFPTFAEMAHALGLSPHELASRAQRRLDGNDVR